jgi:mono/diheme cytochrome c family protein
VEAVSEAEFASFLASHAPGSRTVAEEVWGGVCAKCHGAQGEGDYGRPLRDNPIVEDEAAVRLVLEEGRQLGTKVMPPISEGWSDEQMQAVLQYLQTELGPGGA